MTPAAITRTVFVDRLLTTAPEVGPVVREHLADNDDEVLLHLLLPDLLRAAVRMFHADELDAEHRLLAFVDLALREGDADEQNTVLVSFVEHAGAGQGETPAFLATWPPALRAALDET